MAETGTLGFRTSGPPGALKRELLVDGHPFATTSRDVIRALDLQDGDVIETSAVMASVSEEEPVWANQRGIRLLNHRDRSYHELERRLTEDGYSPQTVKAVLERFVELGAVDDERFAYSLVRTKVLAGWGRTRIRNALRTARIDDALIEQALDCEYPSDDLPRARAIVAGEPVLDARGATRLANKLIRRGFDPGIARTVGFEALDDSETPEEQG